jgi:uncharacterized 2Fe-2S/4Fe-4S cluster protein (DUF4445 family)
VVSGSTIKEALLAAAIPVSMPCGGHGKCGKCVVRVKGRFSAIEPEERAKLPERTKTARLACVARLEGDAEVTIPESSRIRIQKMETRGRVSRRYRLDPASTTSDCYGIAVDAGTNTVVCSLVDLNTGRELGTASTINPQVIHGDDVISRIRFAKESGGLSMLQREIVNLVNGLIGELAKSLGIDRRRIYICSAVGNTAMQHILAGVSPVDLGRAPYRAKLLSSVETLASLSGIDAHAECRLLMPPSLGGFVGGDMVALIVSQALHRRRVPLMAIDLGTNGEIALSANDRLLVCSTAAGPAFEGERISSGVRAVNGAVENVKIGSRGVTLKTIGETAPVGLCGSGLIAAVAELLRAKVIEPSGRIRTPDEIPVRWLRDRVTEGTGGRELILNRRPPVRLSQGDIREVQLGKAAMCAGMRVLAGKAGIDVAEIRQILVAGSFGSALRARAVKRIGLVPPEFKGRIRVIGNSAIEGAKIFLTSREARREAEKVAAAAQHVELFSGPDFKDEFYGSMAFPAAG